MKIIATNRFARSNFEIIETQEAGIVLEGWEVKSIRANNISLKGSYATFKDSELFLINAHINLYMAVAGEELRSRKLLLHKNQLKRWQHRIEVMGATIIPLKIYFDERSKIKVEIAIVKGRKKHDKREFFKAEAHRKDMEQIKNNL